MKKIKLLLPIFVAMLISCFCVFAGDNAPPAIPVDYWGDATVDGASAGDGLAVTAEVSSVNYAQPSQTLSGMYSVILAGGDRELTYDDDRNCDYHWNTLNEACVPCVDEADCIEGPEDGEVVKIKVAGSGTMPYVDWVKGLAEEVDIVTPVADWSKDGCVDGVDFGFYANHYGEICPMTHPLPSCRIYDLILDGVVDGSDFGPFANHYGEGCS